MNQFKISDSANAESFVKGTTPAILNKNSVEKVPTAPMSVQNGKDALNVREIKNNLNKGGKNYGENS